MVTMDQEIILPSDFYGNNADTHQTTATVGVPDDPALDSYQPITTAEGFVYSGLALALAGAMFWGAANPRKLMKKHAKVKEGLSKALDFARTYNVF